MLFVLKGSQNGMFVLKGFFMAYENAKGTQMVNAMC